MNFNVSSAIYFLGLDKTAIDLKSSADSSDAAFSEQLLYACLAFRQLVNMKGDKFASRLGQFLLSVGEHPFQFLENDKVFDITKYAGEQSKKRFLADLQMNSGRPQFKLSTKGLGIFERKLRYYASASVMVLYYFLVNERKDETLYQTQIARIGSVCAGVYFSNQLSVENQTAGALQVVSQVRSGLE